MGHGNFQKRDSNTERKQKERLYYAIFTLKRS